MSEPKIRKPRADALRNREHILSIAREAFGRDGAAVTLDQIVRLSGLGVGTFYRHFPTRDALVEALYLSELEKLSVAVEELSASSTPVEALRQWLLLFVDLMATKMALKEALNAMVGGTAELYACSSEMLRRCITTLTDRAVAAGEIRLDMDPLDLLRALSGVSGAAADAEWAPGARRMVDILVAGLRT